jgi:hypothetical protein
MLGTFGLSIGCTYARNAVDLRLWNLVVRKRRPHVGAARQRGRARVVDLDLPAARVHPIAQVTREEFRRILGSDDRTADREYVRYFLLDDYRQYGKQYNLQWGERFYYVDERPPARSRIDKYVEKNAIRI